MATMTVFEPGGAREFVAPFDQAPLPDWFKTGSAELVIRTAAPADRPSAVSLRCYPTTFEFQAWAPRLAEKHGLGVTVFDLARGLDTGRPVVTLAAKPALLARVADEGLSDLDGLTRFLADHLILF